MSWQSTYCMRGCATWVLAWGFKIGAGAHACIETPAAEAMSVLHSCNLQGLCHSADSRYTLHQQFRSPGSQVGVGSDKPLFVALLPRRSNMYEYVALLPRDLDLRSRCLRCLMVQALCILQCDQKYGHCCSRSVGCSRQKFAGGTGSTSSAAQACTRQLL